MGILNNICKIEVFQSIFSGCTNRKCESSLLPPGAKGNATRKLNIFTKVLSAWDDAVFAGKFKAMSIRTNINGRTKLKELRYQPQILEK